MARFAAAGTFSASGAHTAGHTTDPGTSGHVFVSVDTAAVQSLSDFRAILMAILRVYEGSNDFPRK